MRRFSRGLSALVLAVAVSVGMAVPAIAKVSAPVGGLGGANICGGVVSATGGVQQTIPCGQGEAPTTCTIYLEGIGAGVFTKTFPISCGNSAIYSDINAWANGIAAQYCTGTGISGLTCSVSNMLTNLSSGEVIGTLLTYASGALALPFYSQGGLTSWITAKHDNALGGVFDTMLWLGVLTAVLALISRVVLGVLHKEHPTQLVMLGGRAIIAFAVMPVVLVFTQWILGPLSVLSDGVFGALTHGLSPTIFNASGQVTAITVGKGVAAGFAGLIAVVVALVLMLYLFVMFMFRDVIIAFSVALAPMAVGLAVFDHKNQMVDHWLRLYVGGLLMTLAGAIGVGVTLGISSALLGTAQPGLDFLMGMVMMIGGLFVTAKLMNVVMRGSMSHRSPTSLLLGMGEGAIAGMALSKLAHGGGGAARTGIASGARAAAEKSGLNAAARGVGKVTGAASRAAAGLPLKQSGALASASISTQKSLSGLPSGAVDTALANDKQAQDIIREATADMDPTTSMATRLAAMSSSGEYGKLLKKMVESGVGKAQLMNGTAPEQVQFHYNQTEVGAMMNMAHKLGRDRAAKTLRNGSVAP